MIEPSGERRTPITPQLAMRVAIFGAVAFGLFAIVFFRLWYLQVLSGDQYLAEANSNRFRELRIPAPRGDIVDRSGTVIVNNKRAIIVQLDPSKLPDEEREMAARWGQDIGQRAAKPKGRRGPKVPIPGIPTQELRARYERLGEVINTSAESIHRQVIRSLTLVPYSDVRVKTDVPTTVLSYVLERAEQFPGVTVERTWLRSYPRGTLAAQMLGTVGEISPTELKENRFRGVKAGTIVGKEGLERAYDRYLRGRDGIQRVQVDASGRPIPNDRLRDTDPVGGQRLRVSLDLEVSRTGQRLLGSTGKPGAFVALDPRNGEILGMASSPSFDPTLLTRPITQERYDTLFSEDAGSPRVNRAVSGAYPTGSVFKPITALAALQGGVASAGEPIDDPGCIDIGDREFCNAGDFANGPVDMRKALQVSSDVYFYRMGQRLFPLRNQVLQRWARRLGVGRRTGIDLGGESVGVIPDKKWREERKQVEIACRKREKIPLSDNVFAAGAKGCGISDMRDYNLGDNVNLAVGQGDLQSNPLQMAIAYAAIANGGRIVRPHLGLEIEDDQGRLLQHIKRSAARRISFDDANQQVIMDGLRMAAQDGGGTSADVFADWKHDELPVFGKTGTAERPPKGDQSWYIAYVPHKDRPIVVAVTVEEGGFGAATAAPIACQILRQYYDQQATCAPGKSRTL
ncbi:MAG: penicillin-binding transpeptidase domain-containing protein [Solirubrobacteraceae bacterium]